MGSFWNAMSVFKKDENYVKITANKTPRIAGYQGKDVFENK